MLESGHNPPLFQNAFKVCLKRFQTARPATADQLVPLWVFSIANAMIFHCGRPQRRQQAGVASLLVPLWPFLWGMQWLFIADARRGTGRLAMAGLLVPLRALLAQTQ